MNSLLVPIFFLHTTLATLLLGFKFWSRKDPLFKNFGLGLVLNGLAFVVWSAAVLMKPDNLEVWVTIGVLFFAAALVAFLISARPNMLWVGIMAAIALFLLRTYVYPSHPGFSPEGLFFFNPHPLIQALYIFAISFAVLPAANAIASKFSSSRYEHLVQYAFTALVIGSVILVTSTNVTLLFIDGWVLSIAYLLLWTSLVFGNKAWARVS